ncbi:sulfatase [Sediminitomix flava]|uniref:Arylsulfatase A-like enzyme n=1 Tax=Sediminitomix flava TaxID=379075 RepID=A0A315Z4M8_SEDFL|nr:sulfatase [Sediminitomix flava]PWJ37978.1 arylsulfatase A-like enzyme [Sediminitomix flava]
MNKKYKHQFLIILLVLSGMIPFQALAEENPKPKNVLLIIADDFNHWLKELGYYPQSYTPNLDKLARKGVLFSDAHASSPVCNPSRNALMSGLRPATTGIVSNATGYIREKKNLENTVTLNQYFTQNGYYSYAVGKIYHPGAMGISKTDPENWSELNTNQSGSHGGKFYKWRSLGSKAFSWSAGDFPLEESSDTQNAQSVASFIQNYDKDQPFFIAPGLFRPHLPWNAHKSFFDLFDADTLKTPIGYLANDAEDIPIKYNGTNHYDEVIKADKYKEALHAYLANLAYADYNVGLMLDALENSTAKENTIVVFFGDHGWHLGEKDRFSKHAVFDLAHRTSLIIYDPSAEGNGKICKKVVSLQDIYPTLVELCGIEEKKDIEGRSITNLLQNPEDQSWNHPIMSTYRDTHTIKTNEWRLIENAEKSQLYHTAIDPYEFHNVYKPENMGIANQLRTQMDSILQIGQKILEMKKEQNSK